MVRITHGKKPTTRQIGNKGEQIATDYLVTQGYAIRERNYVVSPYEIDIIAQDGDTLVFVEVKTRSVSFRPDQVINAKKQLYIVRAANAYNQRFNPHLKVRFDVIFILQKDGGYEIKHIKNAIHPRVKTY